MIKQRNEEWQETKKYAPAAAVVVSIKCFVILCCYVNFRLTYLFIFHEQLQEVSRNIDYTEESEWTVEKFVSHRKKGKKQRRLKGINYWAFDLRTRWIAYPEDQDTFEPLDVNDCKLCEENKIHVQTYIDKTTDAELLKTAQLILGVIPKKTN